MRCPKDSVYDPLIFRGQSRSRGHSLALQKLFDGQVDGLLHLQGYDDATVTKRRRMKREEDRWVTDTARRFTLSKLATNSRLSP